ncbi:MAG: hypothetical protein R3284_03320 [Rubricoccaceae bacterium]|nr:hypothetical protein [Rubricoccaceae bacterium]
MSDFDDLDPLSHFDDPDFDDNGMHAAHHHFDQKAVDDMAHLLVSEGTGVKFDALALFSEPLFTAFDLDFTEAFALKESTVEADPEVVTILEAARLLWAFFSLPKAEQVNHYSNLKAHLSGHDAGDEDEVDLDQLIEIMLPYWTALTDDEIKDAENTANDTLSLPKLLSHRTLQHDPTNSGNGYGPDRLSEIEARAIFAEPLLEDPGVLGDVDAFESAVERANQYWMLAEMPEADREHVFKDVLRAIAESDSDMAAFELEARAMITRFYELFPERG